MASSAKECQGLENMYKNAWGIILVATGCHRVPRDKNSHGKWTVMHFCYLILVVSSFASMEYSHRKFKIDLTFVIKKLRVEWSSCVISLENNHWEISRTITVHLQNNPCPCLSCVRQLITIDFKFLYPFNYHRFVSHVTRPSWIPMLACPLI